MAGPACMSQDGNTAVFVGTMLETGDSVALCDECLVMWSAALLSTMTGIDPTPFIAAISEDEVDPASAPGAPTDEPPAPGPADTDRVEDEGDVDFAAGWVKAGEPPPGSRTAGNGGRSPRSRSSVKAPTGGSNADE